MVNVRYNMTMNLDSLAASYLTHWASLEGA